MDILGKTIQLTNQAGELLSLKDAVIEVDRKNEKREEKGGASLLKGGKLTDPRHKTLPKRKSGA